MKELSDFSPELAEALEGNSELAEEVWAALKNSAKPSPFFGHGVSVDHRTRREPELVTHPFEYGQKVLADGDRENAMTVIGFWYAKGTDVQVQCSFWLNGDNKTVWLPLWRLRAAE